MSEEIDQSETTIHIEQLDDSSSYSQAFLTAVYHDNIPELKKVVKKEFFRLNNKEIPNSNKIEMTNLVDGEESSEDPISKSFENEWSNLEIEEKKEENEDELEEEEVIKKDKKDLFKFSAIIATASGLMQLSFLITIIYEYFHSPRFLSANPGLIATRLVCFITISITIWKEYKNGMNIFLHSVGQGFLYRSKGKRISSGLIGLLQCATALSTLYCSSEMIVQNVSVSDCVSNFTCLMIITDVDDYLGSYFIGTDRDFDDYADGRSQQIYVIKQKGMGLNMIPELIMKGVCLFIYVISIIPMLLSIEWNVIFPKI